MQKHVQILLNLQLLLSLALHSDLYISLWDFVIFVFKGFEISKSIGCCNGVFNLLFVCMIISDCAALFANQSVM